MNSETLNSLPITPTPLPDQKESVFFPGYTNLPDELQEQYGQIFHDPDTAQGVGLLLLSVICITSIIEMLKRKR